MVSIHPSSVSPAASARFRHLHAAPADSPPTWDSGARPHLPAVPSPQVFDADLAVHPGNGWALRGRVAALKAQGRSEESRRVERTEFKEAWQHADVQLSGSCPQFSSL